MSSCYQDFHAQLCITLVRIKKKKKTSVTIYPDTKMGWGDAFYPKHIMRFENNFKNNLHIDSFHGGEY